MDKPRTVYERLPWANMPKGVAAIFCLQIFSTMIFAVLFSTMVLYMKRHLGFSSEKANLIAGIYFAYNFGLHLLSGSMAGRLLSYRVIVLIGVLFQLLGCFMLVANMHFTLFQSLAVILVGTGSMVTCINMLVSQLFDSSDKRREKAFLWNYSGMNLGFLLGFAFSGYLQMDGNYHVLFISTGISNLITLVILLFNWRGFRDRHTLLATMTQKSQYLKRNAFGLLIIFTLPVVLNKLLQHPELSDAIVLGIGVFMYLWVIMQSIKLGGQAGKRLLAFVILQIAALMFFVVYQLAPMALTLFAQNNVNRHLYGFVISTPWIPSVNTLTIIIGGPLLALLFSAVRRRGRRFSIPMQFSIGLCLSGLGLLLLPLGIHYANALGYMAFSWLFSTYLIEAIAELCISPIGYSMVGQLAPKSLQSTLMGMVLLNTGVAAVLASRFSNYALGHAATSNPLVTNAHYATAFTELGILALLFALGLALCVPFLNRLIYSPAAA